MKEKNRPIHAFDLKTLLLSKWEVEELDALEYFALSGGLSQPWDKLAMFWSSLSAEVKKNPFPFMLGTLGIALSIGLGAGVLLMRRHKESYIERIEGEKGNLNREVCTLKNENQNLMNTHAPLLARAEVLQNDKEALTRDLENLKQKKVDDEESLRNTLNSEHHTKMSLLERKNEDLNKQADNLINKNVILQEDLKQGKAFEDKLRAENNDLALQLISTTQEIDKLRIEPPSPIETKIFNLKKEINGKILQLIEDYETKQLKLTDNTNDQLLNQKQVEYDALKIWAETLKEKNEKLTEANADFQERFKKMNVSAEAKPLPVHQNMISEQLSEVINQSVQIAGKPLQKEKSKFRGLFSGKKVPPPITTNSSILPGVEKRAEVEFKQIDEGLINELNGLKGEIHNLKGEVGNLRELNLMLNQSKEALNGEIILLERENQSLKMYQSLLEEIKKLLNLSVDEEQNIMNPFHDHHENLKGRQEQNG